MRSPERSARILTELERIFAELVSYQSLKAESNFEAGNFRILSLGGVERKTRLLIRSNGSYVIWDKNGSIIYDSSDE
jgi:hypothetical protein